MSGQQSFYSSSHDNGAMIVFSTRIPKKLIEQIEVFAQKMADERPGIKVTRAEAVRFLLIQALENQQEEK